MPTNIVQQLNTQKLLVIMPKASCAVLVVFIAYAMVNLLWVLLDSGSESNADIPAQPTAALNKSSSENNKINIAEKIAKTNLYGQVDLSLPVQEDREIIDAPDTMLNLKLMGILATGGEDGLAIISSNNKEEMYKVGTQVPGNATLKQVLPDRVILESRRGLETLRLPIEKSGGITISSAQNRKPAKHHVAPKSRSRPSKSVSRKLEDYRKKFIRDPASIGEFADVQPANSPDGRFQGYRIKPKAEKAFFKEIGLESGDIITGVNGVELDKPAKGLSALRKLMNAKELNLTVMRNGQQISIQKQFNR